LNGFIVTAQPHERGQALPGTTPPLRQNLANVIGLLNPLRQALVVFPRQ